MSLYDISSASGANEVFVVINSLILFADGGTEVFLGFLNSLIFTESLLESVDCVEAVRRFDSAFRSLTRDEIICFSSLF